VEPEKLGFARAMDATRAINPRVEQLSQVQQNTKAAPPHSRKSLIPGRQICAGVNVSV
jgi:hypothetical protein